MSFPRYPAYKDSGAEWLGEVPDHWEVRRLGVYGNFIAGAGFPHEYQGETSGEFPFYKVSDTNREDNSIYLRSAENYIGREAIKKLGARIAPAGGIMFPKVGAALLGNKRRILTCDAITDNNTLVFCPTGADSKYWFYWLSILDFGQISNPGPVPSINESQLREFPSISPPVEEQAGISRFLDHETAKIDALIQEQQRLIELLKEKRQAVISHAVTKGLDPSVLMKDSGVEWLGEVPEHWEVKKLGFVTNEKCDGPFGSALKSEHYSSDGVRVVRLQNIKSGAFDGRSEAFIDADYFERSIAKSDVKVGDLLIAGLGDEKNVVGRACVAPTYIEPGMVKADCFRFRLNPSVADSRFIALQLSAGAEFDAGNLASGSTRSRIPLTAMATRKVAAPPVQEQIEIVRKLSDEDKTVSELVYEAGKVVQLLQERRSALISAAVTGKIDVRNWKPPADESAFDEEVCQAGMEMAS